VPTFQTIQAVAEDEFPEVRTELRYLASCSCSGKGHDPLQLKRGRKEVASHAHLRLVAELHRSRDKERHGDPRSGCQGRGAPAELRGRFERLYWTVGPYDLVAIIEAPDEESATAFLLEVGSWGNVRTTTLRAYDREEMSGILQRFG
jgi:GYD domain-containing protein